MFLLRINGLQVLDKVSKNALAFALKRKCVLHKTSLRLR